MKSTQQDYGELLINNQNLSKFGITYLNGTTSLPTNLDNLTIANSSIVVINSSLTINGTKLIIDTDSE